MMAFLGPQQFMYNISRSAPPGWAGPWPPVAPMGYPGPPPPPSGVDVNAWKGGQWQFNPMYVPTAPAAPAATAAPAPAWAPHPSWGVAAQAAPAFNPYKRIPNQGDASYFATDLLDNPLGLENMIPREELEKRAGQQGTRLATGETPTTPWVWAPKELSKSDEQHDHPPETRDGRGARDSQDPHETRERHNSVHTSLSSASTSSRYQQPQQTAHQPQSLSRHSAQQYAPHSAQPQSQHSRQDSQYRSGRRPDHHSRTPEPTPPSSAPATVSSYAQMQRQAQSSQPHTTLQRSHSQRGTQRTSQPQVESQRPEQQQQQQQHYQHHRHLTEPPRTPSRISSASAQARAVTYDETRSEAFSTREALKPTFSPNIVRTPMHYTGVSSASAAVNGSTPTRHGAPHDPRDDQDLSRRLSREDSVSRSAPGRRDSIRRSERRRSPSYHKDGRSRGQDSDDESPSRRSRLRGPIYAPTTSTPVIPRSNSAAPNRSQTSPNDRTSSIPSLTSSMSTLSVDTPPSTGDQSLFLASFTDEPAGVLSPLIVGNSVPSKVSPRDLSRSHTFPLVASNSQSNSYPVIPERSPTSHAPPISRTPSRTPRPSPSQPSPKHIRTPNSIGRSRTYPTLASDPLAGEPPVIPPMPSPVRPSSRAPSPPRLSGRSPSAWNPLPAPPMPVNYNMPPTSASSSASASASASATSQQSYQRSRTQSQYSSPQSHNHHSPSHVPPAPPAPPAAYSSASASAAAAASASRHSYNSSGAAPSTYPPSASQMQQAAPSPPKQWKVRYGFWNRRGDHLTPVTSPDGQMKQYIVYAPRSLANPDDLAQYPTPTEGWKNHQGEFRRYDPSVPEHPESLPSHGEPPVKPYEHFVRYTYI